MRKKGLKKIKIKEIKTALKAEMEKVNKRLLEQTRLKKKKRKKGKEKWKKNKN